MIPMPVTLNIEQPRERLLQHGASVLSDAELLAILLGTGTKQLPVLDLAKQLILNFNGLRGVFAADAQQLCAIPGIGIAKYAQLHAALELIKRQTAETLMERDVMSSPKIVQTYCLQWLAHRPVECCVALYLDARHRLIITEQLTQGTLDQASVYPRELVKAALRHHAAAIILAHNHPSGIAEASQADKLFTQNVKRALALVDIRLLDHIIVAAHNTLSMAEQGLLGNN